MARTRAVDQDERALHTRQRQLELAVESLVVSVESNAGNLDYQLHITTQRKMIAAVAESIARLNELDSELSEVLEQLEENIEVLIPNLPRRSIIARLLAIFRKSAAEASPPFEGLKQIFDRFRYLVPGLIQVSDAADELNQVEKRIAKRWPQSSKVG